MVPQTWKSVHNSGLHLFQTTFMDLEKFPKWRPLEAIRKHVSSTVRWSGLGLSYDDLSEEQSAAHQLKYAILKTLIFKKAQNLKIFKIKWNLTILQLRFCILMAKFGISIKFWSRNMYDDVCMMTFQKCHFLSRIVTKISNCVLNSLYFWRIFVNYYNLQPNWDNF